MNNLVIISIHSQSQMLLWSNYSLPLQAERNTWSCLEKTVPGNLRSSSLVKRVFCALAKDPSFVPIATAEGSQLTAQRGITPFVVCKDACIHMYIPQTHTFKIIQNTWKGTILVSPAVRLGEYRKEPRRQVVRARSDILKEMKMQEPWTRAGKKEEWGTRERMQQKVHHEQI